MLEPNAATITLPSEDIFKALHPPVVTVAPVRPASPTFHFFRPAEVAIHAYGSAEDSDALSISVHSDVPGTFCHVVALSVEYQTPFPPNPS